MTAVSCVRVGVSRGSVPVVHEVDLTVRKGEWLGLVGPNGSGKTTLLHALAGLIPASGEVRIAGVDPQRTGRRATARAVALMPQRPTVPEGVSVRELVRLGRTPHIARFGVESVHDREVVEEVLDRLDLEPLAARPAGALSGGELQRVVLARALAQEPEVLLLDEPTSALDIGHQQQVLDLVDSMRREHGLTVLAAMHDLTSAAQYSERLVLLDGGRVVADGSPAEVLTASRIAQVYGARVEVLHRPGSTPAVLPLPAAGETGNDSAGAGDAGGEGQ
ncbi:ABC transporter ATP-binding protein [Rhodococcus triatomae]|uniref:Iron complex transport system ATP-binding protein n=1 Tax=Rhodococcus triatomae TaxID=300028 RepID=A0A1G8NKW1_9NOCA|nr:ABC transporter ATP-binding protein [Rhodococcus triatomae]QNG20028.1 ABC transporter ATP-binding protein [Rhodococcus triatomae]QNG24056.1 ABC transporter ATP-binding protein [Rhodococcus triatomae]SDI80805.1 iron complex transport system ATP-binding protein [Rhodococcus triatomae]